MFKIKVSNAIIDYARNLLVDHNFGNRGIADGNVHEQLTGLIGQCTIQTLFHVDLLTGAGGFDHGKDLEFAGLAIDVKTMGRTTDVKDYYVNNFIALQKDYPTDAYIFCSYYEVKKELTVVGGYPKMNWKKKRISIKRERNDSGRIKHGSEQKQIYTKFQISVSGR